MPRGNWDWGVNPQGVTTTPEISSSELAARLGSIVGLDRLGEVLFADSFEAGLRRVSVITTGVGASAILNADVARHGEYSMRIATSATNSQETGIFDAVPLLTTSRLGLEVSAQIVSAGMYWILYMTIYTGTTAYLARVRYRNDTNSLEIWSSAGTWVQIATGLTLLVGSTMWSTLKLVIDPVTGHYVRVTFNGVRIDISSRLLFSAANTTSPTTTVGSSVATLSSAPIISYIDDLIITQNEP